jgi:cell wall assembly regulator SMI1
MRKLTWLFAGPGTALESIRNLEDALGQKFPLDYVQFACAHAGGCNPTANEFDVRLANGRTIIDSVGEVLEIDGEDDGSETVISTIADLAEQIPTGVVPVMGTGAGDYICLDLRTQGQSQVVYFSHEQQGNDSMIPLATTLSDFIDTLRESEDD